MPFRWYLGLDIDSSVPDHSTISQNRRRRPSFRKLFRHLFEEVVGQCIAAVLMSGRLIATDSTYVKACASRSTEYLEDAPETPGAYWERLDQYQEDGLAILEQINQELLPIQAATADAAYHIPLVHRVLEEHGISFYVRPQKQGQSPIDKF